MKANDIKLGGFYVSKTGWLVREIVRQVENGNIAWRDYNLSDGQPIGDGVCSTQSLAQWAERIASPEEISRLQIIEARQAQVDRERMLIYTVLEGISDELLLAEVHRRGLKLD